jgi:hypothetical protein
MSESFLRQSPFVFIIRIALGEFLLSLALVVVAGARIDEIYDASSAGGAISYPLLSALIVTAVQLLLIVLVFLSWYYPAYRLTAPAILAKRSPSAAEHVLAEMDQILDVDVRAGLVGRWLGYGTVVLHTRTASGAVRLKNLHDPLVVAEQVRRLLREMPAPPALAGQPVAALVAGGENQFVEFKASLMWDYRKQSVNKELYEPVMKNLVGFMNAQGGVLLIGVGDDGEILGIEQDMSTLKKPGVDGFENVFNVAFGNMIGMEYRQFADLAFPQLAEKTVCHIAVQPSSHPAYLRYQGKEEFYIRAGNGSQALTISRAAQYMETRFAASARGGT